MGARRAAEASASEEELRAEPLPYHAWGEAGVDDAARLQMETALRLPVAAGGALMADAHVGYGLPIGGVLAVREAVIPWAVGLDIACRLVERLRALLPRTRPEEERIQARPRR